jgi:hypothetical protein
MLRILFEQILFDFQQETNSFDDAPPVAAALADRAIVRGTDRFGTKTFFDVSGHSTWRAGVGHGASSKIDDSLAFGSQSDA